jgi:hypothetical protein
VKFTRKRILLSFPQYLYVGVLILHEICSTNLTNTHKCLEKIPFSRRSESKKNFDKKRIQFIQAFVGVGQINGTNFVYIVVLHVKLEPQGITIDEMRAESVCEKNLAGFTPILLPP